MTLQRAVNTGVCSNLTGAKQTAIYILCYAI